MHVWIHPALKWRFAYRFVIAGSSSVIPDVPDLAPDANRSMGARPDDP